MKMLITASALLLALATGAVAAPLDTKDVGADAKWVMHLDLDALRGSSVGERIKKRVVEREKAVEKLKKFQEVTKIDLQQDMHGVTLWGAKLEKETGVFMVHADFDQEHIASLLAKKEDYKKGEYKGHTLHSYTETMGKNDRDVTGVLLDGVAVFGGDAAEVKTAVDVLDGNAQSLPADSPLAAQPADGTIMLVRAKGLSAADLPFKSPVVNNSEWLEMTFGAAAGNVFGRGVIETESMEVAGQVSAVVEGFKALIALRGNADEDVAKFAEAIKIGADEATVTVEWKVADELAFRLGEKMRQRRGEIRDRIKDRIEERREKRGKKSDEKAN